MKKFKKILAAAIAMMSLSTAAAVTGTVAWFTANNQVNVTGMTVQTEVQGNLFIAESNTSDAVYTTNDLAQTVSGKVEPVSTTDGTNWFYTKDKVKGDGSTEAAAQFETYSNNTDFANYYGITGVVPYVDYTFYLKATSSAANQKVSISKANLLYNSAQLGADDLAWRLAIYSQPVAEGAAGSGDGTNVSILKQASAAYFDNKAVASVDGSTKAATFGAVSNLGSEALVDTIATAGSTQRYKVVVRLFLEGNDTKCKNETYVTLTAAYSLSLTCELNQNGVTAISSTAA